MAYFATVHEGVLCEGQPTESYRTSDWTVNVRLMVYCGTFSDEHFASHVCALMRGGASNLPSAHRAIACNMRLDEADALGLKLGMGCWNPRCTRVAPILLPKGDSSNVERPSARGVGEVQQLQAVRVRPLLQPRLSTTRLGAPQEMLRKHQDGVPGRPSPRDPRRAEGTHELRVRHLLRLLPLGAPHRPQAESRRAHARRG